MADLSFLEGGQARFHGFARFLNHDRYSSLKLHMSTSKFVFFQRSAPGDPYNDGMAGRPPLKPAPAFGANLAALRKARGLTQPQLAEALGLTPEMLNYYERRATNPSADFIGKAAAFFGASADDLLALNTKAPRKPGPPSQLAQLTERLSKLPRAQQKTVAQMLEGFLKQVAS
jgi:transcriptional regulator with XRE-family HTH domain